MLTRLHKCVVSVIAGAALCFGAHDARADGYGIYAYLFDYEAFLVYYKDELRPRFKAAQRESIRDGSARSDFDLLSLLEQTGTIELESARMHDGELLWARALVDFVRAIERDHPKTPARFLRTGRLFIEPGISEPCRTIEWIHGACGAYAMFTPAEVETMFWEISALAKKKVEWRDEAMAEELLRFKDLLKEAVLKRRAIYFYGHD